MSAFALRKRLLSGQTDSTPAVPATSVEEQTIDDASDKNEEQDVASIRKSKRSRLSRQKPKTGDILNLVPEAPPVEVPPAQLVADLEKEAPEGPTRSLPVETLPELRQQEVAIEAPPILLSNFKPSRSNYQKRKNGNIHLKLTDGEVGPTMARN